MHCGLLAAHTKDEHWLKRSRTGKPICPLCRSKIGRRTSYVLAGAQLYRAPSVANLVDELMRVNLEPEGGVKDPQPPEDTEEVVVAPEEYVQTHFDVVAIFVYPAAHLSRLLCTAGKVAYSQRRLWGVRCDGFAARHRGTYSNDSCFCVWSVD